MKTLILVAHPNLQESRINRRWAEAIEKQPEVTVHYLYQAYPNWDIDIAKEQRLVEDHDRIVLQFPLYWYSSPALLKKWIDEVLAYGWAYGPGGDKLFGKEFLVATSTGGPETAYQPGGYNSYTLGELLRPFQATSNLIGTVFLPPFTFSINQKTDEDLDRSVEAYVRHVLFPDFHSPRIVRG